MQDLKQKVLENLKTKGYHEYQLKQLNPIIQTTIEATKQALNIPCIITPLLTDKEIEEYIWEEIPISLSQIDIDTHSDGYIRYLNAVHWAKWGRDNCNGL